jgi:hypothetical protein
MAIIKKYKFKSRTVGQSMHEMGGFNSTTSTFTPLKVRKGFEVHQALDAITLAVEAGIIDNKKFVSQLFNKKSDFTKFITYLSEYEDISCRRIIDRWWTALSRLADWDNEEGFVSSAEIAERLLEVAIDSGQIKA